MYINYYIREQLLYEDLHQVFYKSKDILLKKINTIFLKSGKINYHIIKDNIIYIESYRNYIVIHTVISDYTLRYTLKKIQKKLQRCLSEIEFPNWVISCRKKVSYIEVKNGKIIPIGNKYKKLFYDLYNVSYK